MKRKDGNNFHGELTSSNFIIQGKLSGTIGVIRDITERKKTEEAIRQSKLVLESYHKHLTEVRENERAEISRELHDQLGQSLTALKLDLNWLMDHAKTDPETRKKLTSMTNLVTSTIHDVQRISAELRPGILDDLGLAASIEWYAGEFEERSNIRVIMDLDDVQSNSTRNNLAFFRVMQESLTNVIRHSNAKNVKLILCRSVENIVLSIEDDGVGISEEHLSSPHSLGLIGMHERVRQSDGILEITSEQGRGTLIRITIPDDKKNNV
jgi:two-component system sensor histidine kinase UhpB